MLKHDSFRPTVNIRPLLGHPNCYIKNFTFFLIIFKEMSNLSTKEIKAKQHLTNYQII